MSGKWNERARARWHRGTDVRRVLHLFAFRVGQRSLCRFQEALCGLHVPTRRGRFAAQQATKGRRWLAAPEVGPACFFHNCHRFQHCGRGEEPHLGWKGSDGREMGACGIGGKRGQRFSPPSSVGLPRSGVRWKPRGWWFSSASTAALACSRRGRENSSNPTA